MDLTVLVALRLLGFQINETWTQQLGNLSHQFPDPYFQTFQLHYCFRASQYDLVSFGDLGFTLDDKATAIFEIRFLTEFNKDS